MSIARVVTFEDVDAARMSDLQARVQQDGPPEGMPPVELLVLHDAGAYGAAMSSNYVSLGRAPQVFWDDGRATLIARRETLEDLVRAECNEPL